MKKRSMKTRVKSNQTFQQTLDGVAYNNWAREQLDASPKADAILEESEAPADDEVDEELEKWAEDNGYNDDAGLLETSIQLGLSPEGEALLLDEGKPTEGLNKKPIWSPHTLRHTKK
jgi:hypothetical protein